MELFNSKWTYLLFAACIFVIVVVVRDLRESFIPLIKNGAMQDSVMKKGIAVNADIIAAQQTSMWDGGKPVYRITVKFKIREGDEFEASILRPLTFEEIDRFKAGNGTTIKYDPKNPKRIAIYDRPLILGDN